MNAELGVLVGQVDATEAGRLTGQLLVFVVLLGGVLKCWAISRRPHAHRKCVLSLGWLLLALLLASGANLMQQWLGSPPALGPIMGLFALATTALVITSLVYAIRGLREYSREPGRFTQGRAQAIWALGVGGLLCVVFCIGFFSATLRRERLASKVSSSPGAQLKFEELNFQFRAPEKPWVALHPTVVNKDSKLSFMRRYPEAYFMVIAENIGTPEFSTDQLAEVGKAHMQSVAQSYRVLHESPLQLNGLPGLLVETEASLKGHAPFYYRQWYFATNGYGYQLIGYGLSKDRERIAAELGQVFFRFALIDPSRLAWDDGGSFPTNMVSSRYGYTVAVANSGWRTASGIQKEFPEAEFVATKAGTSLVVAPVALAGQELSADALASGLLSLMAIEYPDENLTDRRTLPLGDVTGTQYEYSRIIEKKRFHYSLGLAQTNGTGFLVAAWTAKDGPEAKTSLSNAIALVSLHTPSFTLLSGSPQPTTRERKTQAKVSNHAGLYFFRSGDYAKALPLFKSAAQSDPDDNNYLQNALLAWRHLDRPREALDFLAAQPASMLNVPDMRAWLAFFQAEALLTEESITNYTTLFAGGYRNENHFRQYLGLLSGLHRYDTAIDEAEKYLRQEDSITVRLMEVDICRARKDFPKAASLLRELREKAPFNHQISETLAETSLEAGLYKEALEVSAELVHSRPESPYAFHLKGRSEVGLKWYREAKASFEAAAKLAPANRDIKSYLDYVSGLLGEGNNTEVKEPIEMVSFPSALTNAAPALPGEDYAKKYGAYYSRWIAAVQWEPGKDYRTTDSFVIRVLDQAGVAAFSTVQVSFDPLRERIFVNEVSVRDATSKVISTGQVADSYLLDDPSSQLASHKKVLNIPIPGLQPGCDLAVTVTRREIGRLEGFPFLEHAFSRGFPVRESVFFLRSDPGGLKFRTSMKLEPMKDAAGLYWRVSDPMVARWEPLQAPGASFLPMLWIADASASWPAIASNYLSSIQDRLTPEPTLAEDARGVVAGLDNTEAKMAALARHVQTNLIYKAIEFGRRAQIPNRPADVLRNRYGDCKDHAVLIQQLLQAVGIPAHLALVNAHGPIQQDLPSLDQFNHMIVYVPGNPNARFLDCTDKGANLLNGPAFSSSGRDALVLDPQNPRIVQMPSNATDPSGYSVERRLNFVEPMDLSVDENVTLSGAPAAFLRSTLLPVPATSRRTMLQRQLGLESAEISTFELEGLDATELPLRLHCVYTLKKQCHRSQGRLSTVLRSSIERPMFSADPVDKRLSPFEVRFPVTGRTRVSIDIPRGFRAELPSNSVPKLDPRFARCSADCRVDANQLILEFQCQQPAGQFDAVDYASFRDAMGQISAALEREVAFVTADP